MAEKAVTAAIVGQMIAEAVKGLATEEGVKLLIVDSREGCVTREELAAIVADLATREELSELANTQFTELIPGLSASVYTLSEDGPTEPIPAEFLDGLVFRSSRQKKTPEGRVNVPIERPLTPGDVLNWKDNGPTVSIVTADGRKYTVDKE